MLIPYILTHKLRHTLDIVLTRTDSPIIQNLLPNDVKLSDHFLLEFNFSIPTLVMEYRSITYTDIKSVNNESFSADIRATYDNLPLSNMQEVIPAYTVLMSGIVDTHAPRKTKLVKIVSKAPWFVE